MTTFFALRNRNELADAVYAQATGAGVGGDAYNYGYDETAASVTVKTDFGTGTESMNGGRAVGEGGQNELNAAAGDFDSFNPEQQAQIVMHYYARTMLVQPALDAAAWQPYIDVVRAA